MLKNKDERQQIHFYKINLFILEQLRSCATARARSTIKLKNLF
jgi:hypothetical protein